MLGCFNVAGRVEVISKIVVCRQVQAPQSATSTTGHGATTSRQTALAELCRAETMRAHAPATVLATCEGEYLYSLGPTERFLRVAAGHATPALLSMVADDVRGPLRSAILLAIQDDVPVATHGGQTILDGQATRFDIEVRPVCLEGERFLLIHFLDRPDRDSGSVADSAQGAQVAGLERDLQTARQELQGAVRSHQMADNEQKSINDAAVSVNREARLTNLELLSSKEQLESLNAELSALNEQLLEALERQRTTANDLQNVLFSTDVATLFLDSELKIRFFTPATKLLFHIIDTDIGRPLEDLRSLAADAELIADARTVIQDLTPIEREVDAADGVWSRRVLPYRIQDGAVKGVVITFTDITGRKHTAEVLQAARQEADLANAAKSHFLAVASHDLRQPLQTLKLLQGLLSARVVGTDAGKLVAKFEDTIGAMSGMLNTLLDINQIEAGVVQAVPVDFAVDGLLRNLEESFTYQAKAQGLDLRVVSCGLAITSDPRLLEQMLRNLVSNALKYTRTGKVLLGCRRQGGLARIEVWDTGIGIPGDELRSIFEEYRQVDNTARERSRGLGLGLSIVSRLGALLQHRIDVRSRPDKGSVFTVEVPLCTSGRTLPFSLRTPFRAIEGGDDTRPRVLASRTGTVLVVEDDPEVRELLAMMLADGGLVAAVAPDGPAALALVKGGAVRPDLLLTDYNLPHGMDGLAVAAALRDRLDDRLPVVILTGDISTSALSAIAGQRCVQLNKPVKTAELIHIIRTLLIETRVPLAPMPRAAPRSDQSQDSSPIFIVDDDRNLRESVRSVLENDGRTVFDFATSEAFLSTYRPGSSGCLLLDAYMPGMGGLDLLRLLRAQGDRLPTIMVTGSSDVSMAVRAMKAGAADFIEKPIAAADLLIAIDRALERSRDTSKLLAWRASAADHIAGLTPRQHEIMDLVLAGHPSKNIAADLGISQRTVENHRASIMKTTGAKSIPALARLALAASKPGERATGVDSE